MSLWPSIGAAISQSAQFRLRRSEFLVRAGGSTRRATLYTLSRRLASELVALVKATQQGAPSKRAHSRCSRPTQCSPVPQLPHLQPYTLRLLTSRPPSLLLAAVVQANPAAGRAAAGALSNQRAMTEKVSTIYRKEAICWVRQSKYRRSSKPC